MKRFAILAIGMVLFLACSKSQLLKVVEFQDVEGNSPPIASDVVTIIDSLGFVYEDNAVAVVSFDVHFYEVPFGSSQPPGYGAHLTRYRVTFTSVEGDATVPASHEGALNVVIPPGEEKNVAFVLVPAEAKTVSPLVDLVSGGELRTKALVEFWGVEDKTGEELYASGELDVNFADWADE